MLMRNGLPIIEIRQCDVCGTELQITAQQKRKRYCSECYKQHQKDLQRLYREDGRYREREIAYRKKKAAEKPPRIWICKMCGGEFSTGKGGVPKYCMPCLEELKDRAPFKKYYEDRIGR